MKSALVVGLGSAHGDDQAGWLVIQRLHDVGVSATVARRAAHPADIWDWCDAAMRLIVCDACRGPGSVGTIHCWTWPDESLAAQQALSTHGLSLAEALELGLTLGRCPPTVQIWGIVGALFEPGAAASPAVSRGARQMAEALRQELGDRTAE